MEAMAASSYSRADGLFHSQQWKFGNFDVINIDFLSPHMKNKNFNVV
jgi:hypothetical protein